MVRFRENGTLNLFTSMVLLSRCVTVITSSTTSCGQEKIAKVIVRPLNHLAVDLIGALVCSGGQIHVQL